MSDILALSGYARSGKDTVAEYLVAEHGYTRVAFADALRDALYALNPIIPVGDGEIFSLQELIGKYGWDTTKTAHPEVRALLQRMGTEVGRQLLGDNVWVDIAMRKVAAVDGPVVITDCRFPNEFAAVKFAGGRIWRVMRPGTAPVNPHISETAIDGYEFDGVLNNHADILHLQETVRTAIVK